MNLIDYIKNLIHDGEKKYSIYDANEVSWVLKILNITKESGNLEGLGEFIRHNIYIVVLILLHFH